MSHWVARKALLTDGQMADCSDSWDWQSVDSLAVLLAEKRAEKKERSKVRLFAALLAEKRADQRERSKVRLFAALLADKRADKRAVQRAAQGADQRAD